MTGKNVWLMTAAVCLVASVFLVPVATADTVTIPPGSADPWSDSNHQGPLEQLAGQIASTIAGRPVSVRCESQDDWNVLTAQVGVQTTELGFVQSGPVYAAAHIFVSSATTAELSPVVCSSLQQFAEASTKPTKCQATRTVTVKVTRERLVTRWRVVRVKRTFRWHGRLLTPGLWKLPYKVKVPYTATVTRDVLTPPAPCFLGAPIPSDSSTPGECWDSFCYSAAANEPTTFWNGYEQYAQAIVTLAHEPIHLWQDQAGAPVPPDGLVESQAACYGMQWMAYVAEQLGDTSDDAQALATYFWEIDYPGLRSLSDPYSQSHPYWSADCVPGGALDIRSPGSTAWP